MCLRLIVRLPAHGPWKMLGIAPLGRTSGDKELRHFLRVHVLLDRGIARCAETLEDEKYLLLLDQLADLLNGPWRGISVVHTDEIDLAAIDPALVVDHLEVSGLRAADGP